MSKKRATWLYLLDVHERFIDPQMRWMLAEAQTIEHEYVEISQRVDRLRWNLTQVRQVRNVVEAISHSRQPAVNHFERRYVQLTADAETRARRHDVWNHFRQAAAEM